MIRKYMGTVALGALFVGGLAASHLALAQPGDRGPHDRNGGLIAMADANKDGKVSKAELTTALDARFAKMDANRDGKLTKEDREIRRQARLDERFAALDSDRNGQISKAEFAAGHQGRPDGDGPRGRDGHRFGRGGDHGFGGGMMFRGRGGARGEAMQDGVVTRAEFLARPLAMFDKADANKDGFVAADEMKAARDAMRDAWQARRGSDASPKN
ncbi:EF-hand domain-containing protein [Sphingobium tyrosinilyticum]|uniref:EF-hand domain-containing protein n=1 Tax=Sphingobium tyrosinilyticum TaxID=2715436 RepID=A0ABV9EWY4_9SPHN